MRQEYAIEELAAVTAKLIEKYTSKESTSVPYERAEILMRAVIYCIEEWEEQEEQDLRQERGQVEQKRESAFWKEEKTGQIFSSGNHTAEEAMELGYQAVLQKCRRAKKKYEKLIPLFDDYNCRNYSDTVRKGIPKFFRNYDARFEPQNHILTLDYPTMTENGNLCGIDLIDRYLDQVVLEGKFLGGFPRDTVCQVMEQVQSGYETRYFGNLCYPILLAAVSCVIEDRPVRELEWGNGQWEEIRNFFAGDSLQTTEKILKNMIRFIAVSLTGEKDADYFVSVGREFALRIKA